MSAVYSIFDPLGFIAPYVMKAELLLRLGWDDPLEEDDKNKKTKNNESVSDTISQSCKKCK